jgi:hypothetical protein
MVSEQTVIASISKVINTTYGRNTIYSIDNPSISSLNNRHRKDSAAIDNKTSIDYLTTRYTKTESFISKHDTIRKSSNGTNGQLNNNSLSTLKSKGENNFITRNFFSLVIKDDQPNKAKLGVNSTLYFAPFAGKQIGEIRIKQLDVFGPTLLDTARQATGWIGKSGNVIHLKTTERKLRMQLLFNSGEKVNPQLMADNEKVIRDLPYIQDVAILLSHSEKEKDKVDVLVIIKEKFEYGIRGDLSTSSAELELIDQNMFGIGHELSLKMVNFQTEKPQWGGSFNYEITDLGGKFIKTGLGYTNTYRKKGWNAYMDKQFIASKVDWAGGISLERVFSDNYLTPYSYTRLDTAASYINSDIWYGRQLVNPNIYSDLGNIIIAGRYLHQNYYNHTFKHFENSYFRNHDFIVGSIGISRRYLFKNNQVYGYGITEDIPYGRFAEVALGFDKDANQTRPYLHFRYSKANILKGGAYFKWQFGIGGLISNSQMRQGAIVLNTNYFTNYIYINQHPYRFFVNMELLSGINRFKEEYLVINGRYGIRDFFSPETQGTDRLKINVESVRFWEWNYSGFRVANYFFADAAFLSNSLKTLVTDRFYGGIGFGIRVHNEALVFNVLEIRLSWIPIAPRNYSPFIFNAFGQPKARFDDFLGGKPQEILYQ